MNMQKERLGNTDNIAPYYSIRLMTMSDAIKIAAWIYPAPYEMYSMADCGCIKELLDGSYYAAFDPSETLVGYYCYGVSAQVPAGHFLGAYQDCSLMDIGLGLRPDLCGQGLGLHFLECGILFGLQTLRAAGMRLTVAEFNIRAKKVYERAGFIKAGAFIRPSREGGMAFNVMVLRRN